MTTGVAAACPQCGAPLRFGGSESLATVCAYCRFAVLRTGARLEAAGKVPDLVATETRHFGDALAGLAAVTEILPDDSYLTEFTMRERKITLSGLAASAPKLISALSADERIRNPAFTAPVTRQEAMHKDVFAIDAELAE